MSVSRGAKANQKRFINSPADKDAKTVALKRAVA